MRTLSASTISAAGACGRGFGSGALLDATAVATFVSGILRLQPFARIPVAALAVLLCVLCAGLTQRVAAANHAPPRAALSEYYAERWGGREGLPHNLVSGIVQDRAGFLWMSTLEGAVRYSGREFRVFDAGSLPGLRGNAIRAVAVDAEGRILLATTRDGIARGDAQGWEFLRPNGQTIVDAIISVAPGAAGRVWAGGENSGVFRFDADGTQRQFTTEQGLPSSYVNSLVEDAHGRLWVGTTRGLAWIDGDQVILPAADSGLHAGTVLAVLPLAGGGALIGTDRGVLRSDAGGRFAPLSERLPLDQVTRLLLDGRGDLWIGTTSHGLLRMSAPLGPDAKIERLDTADGLPNSRVSALLEDREGSLWVGTNGGLFRLRLPPVRVLSRRQGLSTPYVRAVAESADGALWAGTSSGLFRIGSEGVRRFGQAEGLPMESVLSLLAEADGGLWIGTAAGGLARWDGERIRVEASRASGLAGDQVRAILRASDGALWVGTTLGLSELRDGAIRNWTVAEGLPRDFVIALHEDARGRIFIGTSNGAAMIESGRLVQLQLGQEPYKDIFDFHESANGSVWMATDLGLLRWREGPSGRVGRSAGVPVDAVFQIVPDAFGGWWLTSNRGLYRIETAAAEAVADGQRQTLPVRHFNESDGMESAQCNGAAGPAALARRDGRLWFGTASGLAIVDPPSVLLALAPPVPTRIKALRVDERSLALGEVVRIPAGSRRIEIDLVGMSLQMPERIQFRYRLRGFDPAWIEVGNRDSVQFTALPPGRYRFEAAARNPGGRWSTPAPLVLEIAPRWWQRTWVRAVLALLTLLAVVAAVQLRLAQLQRAQIRLQRLVEEKTAALAAKAQALAQLAQERGQLADRLQLQAQAFERQASEDYLTGLFNRRAFDALLADSFAAAQRSGEPLCLALIDIDFFKRINDQCSHAAGDAALRDVALLIRERMRGWDIASRWGGEEFAVLLPKAGLEEARRVCEQLRSAIECHDFGMLQPGLRVTVSIGLASYAGLDHHERLIQRADEALYRAKASGRNRIES